MTVTFRSVFLAASLIGAAAGAAAAQPYYGYPQYGYGPYGAPSYGHAPYGYPQYSYPAYPPQYRQAPQPRYRAPARPPADPRVAARRAQPQAPAEKAEPWQKRGDEPGPIQIFVSLPDQKLTAYVNGKQVVTSRVSSGKQGHTTPSGVFSILEKKPFHRSNIYSGAPMPFMQRLTWSGIALHASNSVPNFPASHGCVRLPTGFAKQLFSFTNVGGHVIITRKPVAPEPITHARLFQPAQLDVLKLGEAPAKTGTASTFGVTPANAATPQTSGVPATEEAAAAIAMADNELEAEKAALRWARTEAPVRILITRRTGRELVRDVQELLAELGFDPGDIDGWIGKDTGKAIKAFQDSRGLRATGAMSEELAEQLHEAAGKGPPLTGHLYVRRKFRPVFDAPVAIADPDRPLGSHLYTAMHFEGDAPDVQWNVVTLPEDAEKPVKTASADASQPLLPSAPSSAAEALDRIDIPQDVRDRISRMLSPGSSLAITDHGISKETTPKGTDFVVLTR
ncbi:MAG: L,D-transpeptidase family protein [Hyphomicrobiales bacterium]